MFLKHMTPGCILSCPCTPKATHWLRIFSSCPSIIHSCFCIQNQLVLKQTTKNYHFSKISWHVAQFHEISWNMWSFIDSLKFYRNEVEQISWYFMSSLHQFEGNSQSRTIFLSPVMRQNDNLQKSCGDKFSVNEIWSIYHNFHSDFSKIPQGFDKLHKK